MNQFHEAMTLLDQQLGDQDLLIALATISEKSEHQQVTRPANRIVNAY